MNVALLDVDGHHFPNLALMKLSAIHRRSGDNVEWWNGLKYYDRVYLSKVFTFTPDIEVCIQADEVIKGGTGYNLTGRLPQEVEEMTPDYDLYPQFSEAYGYMTRGCPRQCSFCIVSKKEGNRSQKVADLCQFWTGQKVVKLLDPNLLACPEHIKLIQQLAESRAWIDFTQGLDARCITKANAEALLGVKMKMVHFAFDSLKNESSIVRGLELFKKTTGIDERKTGVYVLTNYDTTHDEDMYRIRVIQKLGYMPYVMVYDKKTAPQITKDLQRWCNNRIIYYSTEKNFDKYYQLKEKKSGGLK